MSSEVETSLDISVLVKTEVIRDSSTPLGMTDDYVTSGYSQCM